MPHLKKQEEKCLDQYARIWKNLPLIVKYLSESLSKAAIYKVKKENVLITGGAGYIGSVLSRYLLKAGYQVTVLDNLLHTGDGILALYGDPDYTFIKGDIRDRECVRSAVENVDAIVHLAAIVGDPAGKRFPKETIEINRDASIELINIAKEAQVKRFIFFSTCSNYGISNPNKLSDEATPLKPISLYAKTKVAVEKYLLEQVHADFSALVLRVSTVFGMSPRMRFDLTVNQFVMEALKYKRIVIFSPHTYRPYIHIHDVGNAVLTCLGVAEQKVTQEVYNLGANNLTYTKMEIGEFIQKHIPGTRLELGDAGEDLRDYRVDFEKWARTFSFVPSRGVENGIRELINVLSKWKAIVDPSLAKFSNA